MAAYYNEHDRFAAAWLRELIKAGLIAAGDVDERDIQEVGPDDLKGYTQCHFFAGIGVWSYALRLAGWPDDRPVWTGSCPCPSFSAAGKGKGFDDARHLWPDWARLIRQRRPATIFGEQVDGAIGYGWLDLVQAELEAEAYAVGKSVLGACSVGAPHIRQRLYFVANAEHSKRRPKYQEHGNAHWRYGLGRSCTDGRMGQPVLAGLSQRKRVGQVQPEALEPQAGQAPERGIITRGYWGDAEWLPCRDGVCQRCGKKQDFGYWPCKQCGGKLLQFYRAVEPGTFPLADGAAARVGRLRGYGNALCAPQAIAFIAAAREARGELT